MQEQAQGLRSVFLPDGQVARLERTAAFERALRVRQGAEDLDDVVDAVSATWWSEGHDEGFRHPELTPSPATPKQQRPQHDRQPQEGSGSNRRRIREVPSATRRVLSRIRRTTG
jgi:hypothetical protein